MMYLIGQLAGWLVLTAAFAGVAGWAFAAQRAAPAEASARRERNRLMRDLINIGVEESAPANGVSEELERQMDILRRRAELDAARVAELERANETARLRGDEAQSHAAELQRALDRADAQGAALQPALSLPAAQTEPLEVEAHPVGDDDSALQMWRLRYFEQRVRYLEASRTAAAAATPTPTPDGAASDAAVSNGAPVLEWRARVAEARAAHLEERLRAGAVPTAVADTSASPFAANADTDVLLRWRLLYLERRVAHLQDQGGVAGLPSRAMEADAAPDPDRWKWRARYLESRVRHLETRLEDAAQPSAAAPLVAEAATAVSAPAVQTALSPAPQAEEPEPAEPAPLVPRGAERRPPALPAARNGAPDDLTLIEGVSLLQQTTLYSLGFYHFDQIAAWTPANIAWVDQYLRLRGRIVEEEWVEQADDLAREGPDARRLTEDETV